MSTIEFKDENGNTIGTETVPNILLQSPAPFGAIPKTQAAVYVKCTNSEKTIAVITTDGRIAAGQDAKFLDVYLHDGHWNGEILSRDLINAEVTGWDVRSIPVTFMNVPVPCIHCNLGHEVSALVAQKEFNKFTVTKRRRAILI